MAIDCLVLGAGQEVGKSCVVVTINGKRIMFDCGMHMAYNDHRQYPDFSRISKSCDFNNAIDCIVITHFHLDHIGALPYFTEICGYNGPIYMTYPTRALAPIMLEDYRKVLVDRRGEVEQFTSDHIAECMKKVIAVDLKQTVQVDKDLQIRAYYAGHVLGAAMFYAKVGDSAMVYTGDYNMTPDRHLGAARIDRLQLDLLITDFDFHGICLVFQFTFCKCYNSEIEYRNSLFIDYAAAVSEMEALAFGLRSTYATTVRDSKYAREREFLKAIVFYSFHEYSFFDDSEEVHKCVAGGGKVLIPAFALGRAQELCILLDDYWERMNLRVPIYFSAGLTIQANMYYKMLISWTSQKVKETYNAFDFKNVHNFDRSLIDAPGPCVLFATPGMLTGGFSLEVFKHWAPSEMNLITLPGYCLAGTIGNKLMSGNPTIELEGTKIDVRCQIHQLAFSPHTDGKGIMDLVKFLSPQHVILVHGEKPKMATLKERIQSELGIKCCDPANNESVCIPSTHYVKAGASDAFIRSCLNPNFQFLKSGSEEKSVSGSKCTEGTLPLWIKDERVAEGILVLEKSEKAKVVHQDELLLMLGEKRHEVQFAYCCPVNVDELEKFTTTSLTPTARMLRDPNKSSLIRLLVAKLSRKLSEGNIQDFGEHLQVESFHLSVCLKDTCPYRITNGLEDKPRTAFFCCTWSAADDKLARKIISAMENRDLVET
ncbi:cleavage and polyadenylation specificity factor subunit 3-II [Citrus sinensis]|uniref:Cleavage and polyadenylation specificity factor subunit 3-II n=1 Tax=Citrus sinensis TaxID=2711 RepID=A0ACB8N9E8_CITSI|nr:cleavage and polyadenylation specificity factor subunit 3-II [Citrus sinensis]